MAPSPFWNAVAPIAAAAHHVRARLDVVAVGVPWAGFPGQPDAFDRNAVGHRVVARRAIGLEAVRERVHAGPRRDEGRHADRQFGVGNDDLRQHQGVEDHLLGVARPRR
jgi:hypothetical protein